MSPFLGLLSFALMAFPVAFAAPYSQNSSSPDPDMQFYYLRVNAPNSPWHRRWLVNLKSDHYLGLENFTVHPSTPPVKFLPISLENGNYILSTEPADDYGDDSAPQLAAIASQDGTQTVNLKVICPDDSASTASADGPEPCPDGLECTTDQWVLPKPDGNSEFSQLQYAGFAGSWQPVIDARPYGWHMYWNITGGVNTVVQLDFVPYDEGQHYDSSRS